MTSRETSLGTVASCRAAGSPRPASRGRGGATAQRTEQEPGGGRGLRPAARGPLPLDAGVEAVDGGRERRPAEEVAAGLVQVDEAGAGDAGGDGRTDRGRATASAAATPRPSVPSTRASLDELVLVHVRSSPQCSIMSMATWEATPSRTRHRSAHRAPEGRAGQRVVGDEHQRRPASRRRLVTPPWRPGWARPGAARWAAWGRRAATGVHQAGRHVALGHREQRLERLRVVVHLGPRVAVGATRAGTVAMVRSSGWTSASSSHDTASTPGRPPGPAPTRRRTRSCAGRSGCSR